jgi:hypothetical protein
MTNFVPAQSHPGHNDVNLEICEAFGCSQKAIRVIEVHAGKFGTIKLSVCSNCIGMFKE